MPRIPCQHLIVSRLSALKNNLKEGDRASYFKMESNFICSVVRPRENCLPLTPTHNPHGTDANSEDKHEKTLESKTLELALW